MTTSLARMRRLQSTCFASITYPAVWMVQGPVYVDSGVPAGTPVVSAFGKLRPSTTIPPEWEGGVVGAGGAAVGCGAGVGVAVGAVVGSGAAVAVGVGVAVGVSVGCGVGVTTPFDGVKTTSTR